jgi:hypothetical protein
VPSQSSKLSFYQDLGDELGLIMRNFFLFTTIAVLAAACSSEEQTDSPPMRNQKGEYIYRKYNESLLAIPSPEKIPPKIYPWDKEQVGNYPKITKEFFRCKGKSLNPCHIVQQNGEPQRHYDCGGVQKHSLPLQDGKEFIYSILIELTNYIQAKTGRQVIITSGHRCPEHNTYVDPSVENQCSKHMIGAEVDFYVQGMEDQPEAIITLIQMFYMETPRYIGQKDYQTFHRYEKEDTNVSTPPWYNKEVFIKLFRKKEGRNFDNRHPYPYISIQVRYDRDAKEKIIYTWEKGFRNYHRW